LTSYYRIMLGAQSAYASEARAESFIGADYGIYRDLTNELPDRWQEFNEKFRPIWLDLHPGKSKISAGLSCSALHCVCKGIIQGDVVLCPDGHGSYMVGDIVGDYSYHPGLNIPHRRDVRWHPRSIRRDEMSRELQNSTGSNCPIADVTKYSEELKRLISGETGPSLTSTDATVEDPNVFALEKHLEEFLIANWGSTPLGRDYDIYEEDGELVGQQYPSDTGPLDILAISKDRKELLVVELKKGRASDVVVGQIQRYMGYILGELAEDGQSVKGVIIALEDDLRIRRALKVANNIDFYRYEVSFNLNKEQI
jgi:restriction system protein